MRGENEHAGREIFRGPDEAAHADALWRAQRELAATGSRTATTLAAEVAAGQAALGGRVFRILSLALEPLREHIERLDRRARRLGTAPIGLRVIGDAAADGRVFVVLAGCAPVLAGWSLAAIVEHRHGPATLRPVSEMGHRLHASAYQAARCEHCGLRRRRAQTFIVVHADSGEIRQVGSGCLRDFVGGHDPDRACRQAEYLALARTALADADHAADTPRRFERPSEPALKAFAAHAAGAVRRGGWASHDQARRGGGAATADVALRAWQAGQAPSPADRALAAAALRWARTLLANKPAPTRFERAAAAVAVSTAALGHRERGLVAALIGVYRRRRARSRHLGAPGTELARTVLVERVLARRSARHGTVRRCELLDADANRLVWWQTEGEPLREGELVTLAGRVARHTHFGATAVTVLSHCRRPGAQAGRLATTGEASPARRLT